MPRWEELTVGGRLLGGWDANCKVEKRNLTLGSVNKELQFLALTTTSSIHWHFLYKECFHKNDKYHYHTIDTLGLSVLDFLVIYFCISFWYNINRPGWKCETCHFTPRYAKSCKSIKWPNLETRFGKNGNNRRMTPGLHLKKPKITYMILLFFYQGEYRQSAVYFVKDQDIYGLHLRTHIRIRTRSSRQFLQSSTRVKSRTKAPNLTTTTYQKENIGRNCNICYTSWHALQEERQQGPCPGQFL